MTITITGSSLAFSGGSTMSPTGSAPLITTRAACVLNGRDGSTITQHNVSSTSRTTTGRYVVNFTKSHPISDICVNASSKIDTTNADGNSWVTGVYRITSNPNASNVTIGAYNPGSGNVDADQIHVIIHST